jgi:hypothetical protein
MCRESLTLLTDEFFDSIEEYLPTQWNGSQDFSAIKAHVAAVLQNMDLFETELQRRIA